MSYSNAVTDDRVYQYLCIKDSVKDWIQNVLSVSLGDDLHAEFKNGVVLCYLMQELDPRSIPHIQASTASPFKLKENINFFLGAIEDYGIRKHRLFYVNDLWSNLNLVNVIMAIHDLALLANERGFRPTMVLKEDKPEQRPNISDELISSLKVQLGKVKGDVATVRKWKKAPGIIKRELALRAGNRVHLEDYEPFIQKFQAYVRGVQSRRQYQKRGRNNAHRARVVNELLQTEKDYVESLDTCLVNFYQPLKEVSDSLKKKKKPWITDDNIKTLFSDLNIIYGFNHKLYLQLEERLENWTPFKCLADIFLQMVQFLKVYTAYVQNYTSAISLYQELTRKDKSRFSSFLKEIRETKGIAHELPSFLIMPVQRVPRYNMLLDDLRKHTWEDHLDYQDLVRAKESVEDVALYLNEKKREAESVQEMLAIDKVLVGCDSFISASRSYIGEYDLKEKNQDRKVYLFSNLVVVGKPNKDTVKFRMKFEFNQFTLLQEDDKVVFGQPGLNLSQKPLLVLTSNDAFLLGKFLDDITEAINSEKQRKNDRDVFYEQHHSESAPMNAEEELVLRKRDLKEKLDSITFDENAPIETIRLNRKRRNDSLAKLHAILETEAEISENQNVHEELNELKIKLQEIEPELTDEDRERLETKKRKEKEKHKKKRFSMRSSKKSHVNNGSSPKGKKKNRKSFAFH
eukprot:TRINITY_DN7626_c0_g1_i1.p1 TRINITY_DN7626_c0_g1~~TRINITY_DN7626_c0_g1_i1.p1  ORF type:complete len:708 (-),score=155.76 TRINITY_DN7626_c0_g1_i1:72-2132(-)